MAVTIRVKRIYEEADPGDGCRILVDRLWPRGVRREEVRLDIWARELAPSTELRRWFDHIPERFDLFTGRYLEELSGKEEELRRTVAAGCGVITLLYGARDPVHNHARVLAAVLERYARSDEGEIRS